MRRRWLFRVAIIFGLLIITFSTTVFVLLEWPLLLINPTTVTWALKTVGKKSNVSLSWSNLTTQSTSVSIFEKQVQVHFETLCAKSENKLDACFEKFEIGFRYRFFVIIPSLRSIGPVNIVKGNIKYDGRNPQTTPSEDGADKPAVVALRNWLLNSQLESIEIDLPKIAVYSADNLFKGHLKLNTRERTFLLNVFAAANEKRNESEKQVGDASLEIEARSDSGRIGGPWLSTGKLQLDLSSKGKGDLNFSTRPTSGGGNAFDVVSHFQSNERKAEGEITGTISSTSLTGVVQQTV